MAEPVNPPVSPWAERFGVSNRYPWKDENKSGLHPQYPDIDVRYPDTLSPEAWVNLRLRLGGLLQPSDPELDRLFLDETYQFGEICGYTVWQALILGGLRKTEPTVATVNEASWLPLWAKKRWYNLNHPLPGTLDKRLPDNATWSVDEPVFWERLSPAIELADRLMRAALDHPILDAILGVKDTDYYPNHAVADGLNQRPLLAKNNTPPLLSRQQLLDTLERYAEMIVLTIMPPNVASSEEDSYGITIPLQDPNIGGKHLDLDFVAVMLNPLFVSRLLDPTQSAELRAQAILTMGITLAHEMMHAIYNVKLMLAPAGESDSGESDSGESDSGESDSGESDSGESDSGESDSGESDSGESASGSSDSGSDFEEPFYAPPGTEPEDSAWLSELGMSWEQSILGGTMDEVPKTQAGSGGMFMFATDLPNYNLAEGYGFGIDLASHKDDTWYGYALPAFVTQLYGSDEFWKLKFVKYGLPALYVPKLFRTKMDNNDFYLPELCQLQYALPEFHPQLEEYGEKFRTRQSQWKLLRPWYHEMKREWDNTPYSRLWLRTNTARFRAAHRKGNEWEGQKCYQNLNAHGQWEDTFTANGFLLDQDADWVDRAFGYLMLVIMPIREEPWKRDIPFFSRNEFSPGAAAVADAVDRSVRTFDIEISGQGFKFDEKRLEKRNIAFAPLSSNKFLGTRATLVKILKDEIPNRQRQDPIPDHLYQALKAMLDNVDREEPKYQVKDQWLSDQINVVLPPYQREQAMQYVGYSAPSQYVPYNPSAQPQQYVPGAASPPQQGSTGGSGPGTTQPPGTQTQGTQRPGTPAPSGTPAPPESPTSTSSWTSSVHSPPSPSLGTPTGSGSAVLGRSPRGRRAHRARRVETILDEVYYSVGEVGDHISTGDLWIIADDGVHGYDVYDATDVVEEMWADDHVAFSLDNHCERTLLGLKARPYLQQSLEEQAERLGKIILPMRRHEIAERDGRYGRPMWISVGNDVFDISNFPFENEHQRKLMTRCPGRNPWSAIVKDGTIDYDQLAIDLEPYRCAVVASRVPDKGPGPKDEFHFTLKEVACHVYPEATMYTIIRGQVYNLNGYMDFHPGGKTILRQWAGRDSTREFERYHADADRCLADYDYLRVGRVVEEKPLEQLTHNEVALNGHVYDLRRMGAGEPEREFLREIDSRGLRSRDITSVLNDGFRLPPASLLLLPQRPDLITAKLADPLSEIDMDTLRANDGSHMPLPDGMKVPRSRIEADLQMPLWVSYDGLVYDMTAVSKWGPEDIKAELNGHDHRYRGAIIPPSALATRLQRDFGCRVIGRLVRNSGRPRDEEDGGDDDDGRAHQRPRLH